MTPMGYFAFGKCSQQPVGTAWKAVSLRLFRKLGEALEGKTRLESRDHVATDPFKDR